MPALLKSTASQNAAIRVAAPEALQILGNESTTTLLIPCLLAAKSSEERAAAERAVWACAERDQDAAHRIQPLLKGYEQASLADRAVLLPVLGRIGGPQALEVIHAAASDTSLRAASVRELANWPNAGVADERFELACSGEQTFFRIWALRGYIRVVTLPGVRSADETLALLEPALDLDERPDEIRLILGRLPAVPPPRSLQIAVDHLDHAESGAEPVAAATKLAETFLPESPELARHAMMRILKATTGPVLRARRERATSKST